MQVLGLDQVEKFSQSLACAQLRESEKTSVLIAPTPQQAPEMDHIAGDDHCVVLVGPSRD